MRTRGIVKTSGLQGVFVIFFRDRDSHQAVILARIGKFCTGSVQTGSE